MINVTSDKSINNFIDFFFIIYHYILHLDFLEIFNHLNQLKFNKTMILGTTAILLIEFYILYDR